MDDMLKATFLTILALQICLDRRGFSPNTADGQVGTKTRAALAAYCAANGLPKPIPGNELSAVSTYFPNEHPILITNEVTEADIRALTHIPQDPKGKSLLTHMGYETIKEMFAERGHVTENTLARLNPQIDWNHVTVGTPIVLPDVSPVATGPKAALVKVSLSTFSITVCSESGKPLSFFPCSIAKNKSKRPAAGEIKIVTNFRNPNYTYTPEFTPKGKKSSKYIFPPGPNNPVGTVWLGLSLPSYGIHGTPKPESIGRAESHGCFRLANWNAEKLFELVKPGTKVIIEQ